MQCGRADLKSASYDTIQLNRGPSWLDKDCSSLDPPCLNQILVHMFLLPASCPKYSWRLCCGVLGPHWVNSHHTLSQEQIPNPLFDLAGIMCGQFGVPFWEFFFATLIGKALGKTHIQTVFIISVCNNQLLHWVENELLWVLSFIPGLSSVLSSMMVNLHAVKDKYLMDTPPGPPDSDVLVNYFAREEVAPFIQLNMEHSIWLVLINFFFKIINSIAQGFLKKRQEEELVAASKKKKPAS